MKSDLIAWSAYLGFALLCIAVMVIA